MVCDTNERLELLPFLVRFDRESCEIACEPCVSYDKRSGKTTEQMRGVLWDPSYGKEEPFYSFYENLAKKQDAGIFKKHGVRYDLIVLRPGTAGEEFKKTSGHYHCAAPDGAQYPEIYEVLQGKAAFVLQRCGQDGAIEEAYVVQALPGDKLLIPPGYGHATVNTGGEPLVFADLVAASCKNTYGQIAQNSGMCYHILKNPDGGFTPVGNPAYGTLPPAVVTQARPAPARGLDRDTPLYQAFTAAPETFEYLTHPMLLQGDAHTF